MPVVCLGLSHHTAPVDVRAHHAFPAARMSEALVALRDYEAVREAAMLQTCGRIEIYAEIDDYEAGVGQLKSFLSNFRHGSVDYDLDSYLYTLLGSDAVEHLFRVATGLDSMVIGEAEVLGQLKTAYVQAHHAGSLGKTLHRLFRDALNAGKTARSQTGIGDSSPSVATAAIDAALQQLGTLRDRTVLVVGAGAMGQTLVRRLRDIETGRLLVVNRTIGRARDLIAETGFGDAVELHELGVSLREADLVVTSTGASDFVLDARSVFEAMHGRAERPLTIVDIAVPRDVDPEVASIDGVHLFAIDDLQSIVDERLGVRRQAIPDVEEIIDEYIGRFQQWYQSRMAVPIIAQLTQKAEATRVNELERLFARCPDLTERERLLITGMSMTIVSKLLHGVILKIREKALVDRNEALLHARVLDELFELDLTEHIANLIPHPVAADAAE
jgi:glutamyl-tRNA reductase